MKPGIGSARAGTCIAIMLLTSHLTCRANDLLSFYREALVRDPVFLGARHALTAAEQRLPQARAGILPSVTITGGVTRQSGEVAFNGTPFVDREARNQNWSLQLNQPLFRPVAWHAVDQAEAQVRQATAQFDQASQELILRVAQAYFDVVLAKETLAVTNGQQNALEQQWAMAKRNFAVGMSTVTDVHEAKSRLDLTRAQKITAENELTVRRAELERIAGLPPEHERGLDPTATLPTPQPANVAEWVTQAASTSPLIAIQNANLAAYEHELSRNRASHSPTLDFNASYGKTSTSGSLTSPTDIPVRNRVGQVGLQFAVPIWSGGATAARVEEARASMEKARSDLEAARRQAITLTRQAFSGVVTGQAQIEALSSAVVSSQDSVEANRIGYRIGTRINIDVLNAEQQLYAARRDLARAKIDTLMHGVRLKAATGTLDESAIIAINNLLSSDKDTP